MQATSDTICPLYALGDGVSVLQAKTVIKDVSFAHCCTASCCTEERGKLVRVEREDIVTDQSRYNHDYTNNRYCYNIYCLNNDMPILAF